MINSKSELCAIFLNYLPEPMWHTHFFPENSHLHCKIKNMMPKV